MCCKENRIIPVINTHRYIFLLGGHDLEMTVIRTVLTDHGYDYFDRSLSWDNAKLSAYRDELTRFGNSPEYRIYGIELSEDIGCPQNYTRIDHHNDYNGHPSSISQVMEILSIGMTRFHHLVAANDEAYIPGMEAIGATASEIAMIRKLDRQAQGITEEDEKLAEKSIRYNLSEYTGLMVVRAETGRFPAICDKLYPYNNLLIYTQSEWTFYGPGTQKVINLFKDDIQHKKIYYGGGRNGYVGIANDKFSQTEIKGQLQKIINEYI